MDQTDCDAMDCSYRFYSPKYRTCHGLNKEVESHEQWLYPSFLVSSNQPGGMHLITYLGGEGFGAKRGQPVRLSLPGCNNIWVQTTTRGRWTLGSQTTTISSQTTACLFVGPARLIADGDSEVPNRINSDSDQGGNSWVHDSTMEGETSFRKF